MVWTEGLSLLCFPGLPWMAAREILEAGIDQVPRAESARPEGLERGCRGEGRVQIWKKAS